MLPGLVRRAGVAVPAQMQRCVIVVIVGPLLTDALCFLILEKQTR